MIYAATILESKFVKIGFSESEDVGIRLATLQTGSPFEIGLIFAVEGSLRQEKSLHASLRVAFGRIRVPMPPNEWYPGKNPFFQQFLDHLRFGASAGLAFAECYNPSLRQPGKKNDGDVSPNLKWPKLKVEF